MRNNNSIIETKEIGDGEGTRRERVFGLFSPEKEFKVPSFKVTKHQ
jgi:hypothetical protein